MSVNLDKLFTDLFLKNCVEIMEGKTAIRLYLMHKPKNISVSVSKQHGDHHGISSGGDSIEECISILRASWFSIHKTDLPEDPPAPVRTWYVSLVRGHRKYPFTQSATRPRLSDYECVNAEGVSGHMFAIDVKKFPELNEYESDGQGNIFVPEYSTHHFSDYCDITNKSM